MLRLFIEWLGEPDDDEPIVISLFRADLTADRERDGSFADSFEIEDPLQLQFQLSSLFFLKESDPVIAGREPT
jgi:hypothetical protein